ncbi:preprotein translocase subunit SecG [candidate division WOR-3 bacterium]|nr:preprotein translocase subunit SecG [candidate division WOR-3 bacterium]
MTAVLLPLHIVVSIVLIIIILIQQSQGEGLSGVFGGMGNTMFGGSGGTTFLIKLTIILSVIFALLTLSLVVFGSKKLVASGEGDQPDHSSSGGRIELQPYIGEYSQETAVEDTAGGEDDDFYQSLLLTSDTIKDTLSALEIQEDTTHGVLTSDTNGSAIEDTL